MHLADWACGVLPTFVILLVSHSSPFKATLHAHSYIVELQSKEVHCMCGTHSLNFIIQY